MGFQKTLNRDLPVGIEGDFASTNQYHTLLAGEGKLKSGANGVYIGRFAWADPVTGLVSNAQVANGILGFVRRDNTALINPLQEASLLIPAGFGITLYDGGDFWARFAAVAAIGQKVFASITDGTVTAAATAPANTVDTGFVVASAAAAGELAKITK